MENSILTSVMFTDIYGYTRLMGEDEPRTLQLLEIHKAAVEKSVTRNDGQVIKMIGDAFMVHFDDPANAVKCALEIQKDQAAYNRTAEERMQFLIRIGIHYGIATIRDNDLFGSGVNIASRIEPLATPGGICITSLLAQQISNNIELKTFSLGTPKLKNVSDPIEVLHLLTENMTEDMVRREQRKRKEKERRHRVLIGSLSAAAIMAVAVIALIFSRPSTVGLAPVLPEVPLVENRVAILPLQNLTGDSTKVYLAQGLADQLIFQLSRIQDLYVYSLTDVLSLNERFRNVKGIKRGLGAKYLVTGSLAQKGDSLQVMLEIVDTETANRILTRQYSQPIQLASQTSTIMSKDVIFQILGRVSGEAEAALAAFAASNEMASDLYLQALYAEREALTWRDMQRTAQLFEKSIEHDSLFALGRASLALFYAKIYEEWDGDSTWISQARKQAELSAQIAPGLAEAHNACGAVFYKEEAYDSAEVAYMKALSLRPDYREPRISLAYLYENLGRYDEANTIYSQSYELNLSFGDHAGIVNVLSFMAAMCINSTEFDKGDSLAQVAMEMAEELSSVKLKADLLDTRGQIAEFRGDYKSALDYYQQELAITETYQHPLLVIKAQVHLATIYNSLGDRDKALEVCKLAEELNKSLNNKYEQFSVINTYVNIYYYLGKYDIALDYLEEGLQVAKSLQNLTAMATVKSNMGSMKISQGRLDEGEQDYLEAAKYSRMSGDRLNEVYLLMNLGQLAKRRGEIEKARDYYNQSLSLAREANSSRMIVYNLNHLLSLEVDAGHLEEALQIQKEAEEVLRDQPDPHISAGIFFQIYRVHWLKRDYQQAETAILTARSMFNDLKEIKTEFICLGAMIDLDILQKRCEKAASLIDSLEVMSEQSGNKTFPNHVAFFRLVLKYHQQDWDGCIQGCDHLDKIAVKVDNHVMIGQAYREAALIQKNHTHGQSSEERAILDRAIQTGNIVLIRRTFTVLIDAHEAVGDNESATSLIQQIIDYTTQAGQSFEADYWNQKKPV